MRQKETELEQKQGHSSLVFSIRLSRRTLSKICNGQVLLQFSNPLYMFLNIYKCICFIDRKVFLWIVLCVHLVIKSIHKFHS